MTLSLSLMSTVIILTSASSSPWTVPSDWNPAANTIERIGGGGGGGNSAQAATTAGGGGGGGGGGYRIDSNVALSGTVAFAVGSGGARSTGGGAGVNGGATTFTGLTSTPGGTGGTDATTTAGGAGGAGGAGSKTGGTGGTGATGNAVNIYTGGGGGGGAAGPSNGTIGGNGSASSSVSPITGYVGAGGRGDGSSGGAGGTTGAGSAGTELGGGSAGSGGGGCGTAAGTGGAYGAGGGGGTAVTNNTAGNGANGANGVIIITYTPLQSIPTWDDSGKDFKMPRRSLRSAHLPTGEILPQPPILDPGTIEAPHVNAPMDPARKRILRGPYQPVGDLPPLISFYGDQQAAAVQFQAGVPIAPRRSIAWMVHSDSPLLIALAGDVQDAAWQFGAAIPQRSIRRPGAPGEFPFLSSPDGHEQLPSWHVDFVRMPPRKRSFGPTGDFISFVEAPEQYAAATITTTVTPVKPLFARRLQPTSELPLPLQDPKVTVQWVSAIERPARRQARIVPDQPDTAKAETPVWLPSDVPPPRPKRKAGPAGEIASGSWWIDPGAGRWGWNESFTGRPQLRRPVRTEEPTASPWEWFAVQPTFVAWCHQPCPTKPPPRTGGPRTRSESTGDTTQPPFYGTGAYTIIVPGPYFLQAGEMYQAGAVAGLIVSW
jgi:hypothetical protein